MSKARIHWDEYQWRSNPIRTEVAKYYLELRKPKTAHKETSVQDPVEAKLSGSLTDRGSRDLISSSARREKSLLNFRKVQSAHRNRTDSILSITESVSSVDSSPQPREQAQSHELKATASSTEIPATRSPRNIAAERVTMQRLCRPQKLPFYATEEYKKIHYNPALRPSTLDYSGFLPLLQGCTSACPSVQVSSHLMLHHAPSARH